MPRWIFRRLALRSLLGLLASALLWSAPAVAHAGPVQVFPEARSTVGGDVTSVALVFVEPLTDVELEVIGPDGQPVPGTLERPQTHRAELTIHPIEAPGSYLVRYRVTFEDGADFAGEHRFTYDPTAPEAIAPPETALPQTTLPPTTPSPSSSNVSLLLVVGGPVVLLGVAGGLMWRRQHSNTRGQHSTSRR